MMPSLHAVVDELQKLGAVSPDEARRALDRLDNLEANKPTVGQVARYGGIGAVAGPAVSVAANVAEHGVAGAFKGGPRAMLGSAVKSALGAGAIPLVQRHFDQRAQMGTLKNFMNQQGT